MAEWKWIDTLTRQFELCQAGSGRDVVVVATSRTPQDLIDTALIALQRTGALGSLFVLPSSGAGETPRIGSSVRAALDTAELIVDCTSHGLDEMTDTDILVLGSRSPVGMERHVPHPGMEERVHAAEKLLRACSTFVTSSAGGTQLTLDGGPQVRGLGELAKILGSWGCPGPERRVAHWPSGRVDITLASDHTSTGTVVLMPGDLNVTLGEVIHSPVTLEIEDGRICEIGGESGDADLLRAFLESFDDTEVYRLVRATIGLNHAVAGNSVFTRSMAPGTSDMPGDQAVLAAGQLSLGFGGAKLANARGAAAQLVIGLRSATVDLGSATPIRDGVLMGEVAPDVYETAASLH